MAQEIDLGGTIYISSKRAAEITGYAQDYIGQLARSGAIDAKIISGLWYVREDSLKSHKEKADAYKPEPPKRDHVGHDTQATVSFDGKDYISAQRAAKVTGYNADYVTQLARSGKILSRQIGNRWFVDREGIVEHKKINDALLAKVQAESVGLERQPPPQKPEDQKPEKSSDLHFTYMPEASPLMPKTIIAETKSEQQPIEHEAAQSAEGVGGPVIRHFETEEVDPTTVDQEVNNIPIRVIPERKRVMSMTAERFYEAPTAASKIPRMTIFFLLILAVVVIFFMYPYALSQLLKTITRNTVPTSEVVSKGFTVRQFMFYGGRGIRGIQNYLESLLSNEIRYSRPH